MYLGICIFFSNIMISNVLYKNTRKKPMVWKCYKQKSTSTYKTCCGSLWAGFLEVNLDDSCRIACLSIIFLFQNKIKISSHIIIAHPCLQDVFFVKIV